MVKRLADDIQWTTDLGNAFLAQQSDVMDAVQRMRKKAQDKGNLKSTEQQKVETKVIENKSVIVVEQANPQVVYVPSYDPVVVYGPAYLSLPSDLLSAVGYYAAGMAISFGVGVVMGAFWSGGWGWGCGWGGNDININRQQQFQPQLEHQSRQPALESNRGPAAIAATLAEWAVLAASVVLVALAALAELAAGGGWRWRAVAATNGNTIRNIVAALRTETGRLRTGSGARRAVIRLPTARRAPGNRLAGKAAICPATVRGAGVSSRAGGGTGVSNRGGSRCGNRASGGGADRIGSRDLSRSGGGNRDAFGGGSRGYSGSSARGSSSRGSSSMGSRGGGGGSRGGGGGGRRR